MVEARQIDQWNHTSALWFGQRLLIYSLAKAFGDEEMAPPDPLEIHPFSKKIQKPVSPDAKAAADKLARENRELMLMGEYDPEAIAGVIKARLGL